ncbi:hypothetical protein AMELA_G00127760 [Ameiurus melas]|uniref:Uncharacterized protein n=1 Tax=Ameiurus melas TaxID=219545 RepID=A0A7J6AP78_AMEME|nr:hypothetical protein AMELA_G00127760 [Ameiurus melas]
MLKILTTRWQQILFIRLTHRRVLEVGKQTQAGTPHAPCLHIGTVLILRLGFRAGVFYLIYFNKIENANHHVTKKRRKKMPTCGGKGTDCFKSLTLETPSMKVSFMSPHRKLCIFIC